MVLADVDGEIFWDVVAMDFEADWPNSGPCVDVGLDSQTIDNLYVRPRLPIFQRIDHLALFKYVNKCRLIQCLML